MSNDLISKAQSYIPRTNLKRRDTWSHLFHSAEILHFDKGVGLNTIIDALNECGATVEDIDRNRAYQAVTRHLRAIKNGNKERGRA